MTDSAGGRTATRVGGGLLTTWALLLAVGLLLRFCAPVVVWTERPTFGRNAWAPFPGYMQVAEHVQDWPPCERQALLAHERHHWNQQLRSLLVGMWVPYAAGKYLGIGDAHLRLEAEGERVEQRALRSCRTL